MARSRAFDLFKIEIEHFVTLRGSSMAFQQSVQRYSNQYSLGCTRTSTEIPFDELILKMMRVAGAVR